MVWRRLSKSPALVQDPEILCRTYLVYAEASLQLGRKKKAEEWVKRLAGSCATMYRAGKWRAKSSPASPSPKKPLSHVAPAQVTILTEQAGAQVFLDARLMGTTPMHLTGITAPTSSAEESNRKPWVKWVELSAAPKTLRIQGQRTGPAGRGAAAASEQRRQRRGGRRHGGDPYGWRRGRPTWRSSVCSSKRAP